MSVVLALVAPDARPAPDAAVTRMLACMAARGTERVGRAHDQGVTLAVGRYEWEMGPGHAGPVLLIQEGDVVVAADAALYYRDDLRRALAERGVRPTGHSPAHLISAAYRAWGARCAEYLEGDFAFVVHDRRTRTIVAARDFTGSRPLHWGVLPDGTLVVASTVGGIVGHPAFDPALDLAELALEAGGLLLAMDERTVYRDVRRLAPGHTLVHAPGAEPRIAPHWQLPTEPVRRPSSYADGARELRGLLEDATYERMALDGPTCIWLSGGRDSTAIFGAGRAALEARAAQHASDGSDPRFVAVSYRLPADDPGNETHHIEAVAERWRQPVRWLDATDVPVSHAPLETARHAAEPVQRSFGHLMTTMMVMAADEGARVVLTGHGGDLLYTNSYVMLADYIRTGRLLPAWRMWRRCIGWDLAQTFKWGIQPLLPDAALRVATALRGGRRLHGYWEELWPSWFRADFKRAHDVDARLAASSPRATRGERSLHEISWLTTRLFESRLVAEHHTQGLATGTDLRHPLMDRRVAAFIAGRPATDRRHHVDTKRLLRASMTGLLPESVLAPRTLRTGALGGYVEQTFPRVVPLLHEVAREPILAELGIVDPAALRTALHRAEHWRHASELQTGLLTLLHVELWTRERLRPGSAEAAVARVQPTRASDATPILIGT